MARSVISDIVRQKKDTTRSRRKVERKDQLAILKESMQLGCVSQDSYPV